MGSMKNESALRSALYEGSTTHIRRQPSRNKFMYSLYMGFIDLAEAETGKLECWPLFSTTTSYALLSLRASDHMVNEDVRKSLSERVGDVVESATGERPAGPIRLLTNLRVLGVEFNPISFYYVYEPDGERVQCVVAEVGNFPWFQQHNYVILPVDASVAPADGMRRFGSCAKAFHVSPFMGMVANYDWMISAPGDAVRVRIGVSVSADDEDDSECRRRKNGTDSKTRGEGRAAGFFMATLDAKRVEWGAWEMIRLQVQYPVHALRVMGGILYEASKLMRAGFTFFPHPDGTETRLSRLVASMVRAGNGIKDGMMQVYGTLTRVGHGAGHGRDHG